MPHPKNRNTPGTFAFDLEEALCNVLLGEKIPLDVIAHMGSDKPPLVLIPARRKITRTLIRAMVKHHATVDCDPSPIRNRLREIIARVVALHPPTPEAVTDALRMLLEEVDEYKGHGNPGFPYRAEAYLAIANAKSILKRAGVPFTMRDTYAG